MAISHGTKSPRNLGIEIVLSISEQLVSGIYISLGTSMLPLPFPNCLCIVAHLVNQPSGLCGWTTETMSGQTNSRVLVEWDKKTIRKYS